MVLSPHVHKDLDELMYVLVGIATVMKLRQVDGIFVRVELNIVFGMDRKPRLGLLTSC